MSSLTDEELVAKYLKAGRPAGTGYADELFQRHYGRVALWCFRLAGDRDVATDLAQDVFVKAWAHLDHFRMDSRFSTWLYMIARNHCFNALRQKQRNKEDAVDRTDIEDFPGTTAGFDQDLERKELAEVAREMMAAELSPVEARVMMLHFVEEISLSAITRSLGLGNASGAKAHVVSAKRKLKTALNRLAVRSRRLPTGEGSTPDE